MPAACRPGGPRERALRPASHGTEGREPLRSRRWVLALPGPLAAGHRPQTPREAQRPRRPVAAGGVPSEFTTASTDLGGNERGWAALNEQGTVTSAPCSAHPGDEPEPGRCAAAPPARSAPFRPFPSRGTGAEVRAGPAPSPPCPSRAEPAAPAPRTAAAGRNRAARRAPSRRRPAGPAESAQLPGPAPYGAPVSVPGPQDASFPGHGGCSGPGSRARARGAPLLGPRPRGESDKRQQRRHRHGVRTGRRFRSSTAGLGGRRAAPHRPAPPPGGPRAAASRSQHGEAERDKTILRERHLLETLQG